MPTARVAGVPLVLALLCGSVVAEEQEPTYQDIVHAAITGAGSIPRQAEALARLAWPAQPGDPEVAAFARHKLVHYGRHGIGAIRDSIKQVKPEQQADVVTAFLEAFKQVSSDIPPDYLPGLEEAIWFGTREARKHAMSEIARFRFTPALLPIIDAAIEDPELLPSSISALAQMGSDRARFFLEKVMNEGDAGLRSGAAAALAQIGARALQPLKTAMRSEDKELRLVAVRALLPVASVDDLSALHEYVYSYPDDDPGLVRAVRESAVALENLLDAQQTADAASPPPDF